jgi:hypothetical protein
VPRDQREKILDECSGPEGTDKMFCCPLVMRDGRCEARGQQSPRRRRVRQGFLAYVLHVNQMLAAR